MVEKIFSNKMALIYLIAFVVSTAIMLIFGFSDDGSSSGLTTGVIAITGLVITITQILLFIWLVIKIVLYVKTKKGE